MDPKLTLDELIKQSHIKKTNKRSVKKNVAKLRKQRIFDLRYKILEKKRNNRLNLPDARHTINQSRQRVVDNQEQDELMRQKELSKFSFASSLNSGHWAPLGYTDFGDVKPDNAAAGRRINFWNDVAPFVPHPLSTTLPESLRPRFFCGVANRFRTPSTSGPRLTAKPKSGYKLVIGNLATKVSIEDIEELFGCIGPLLEARITRPGAALVVYKHRYDAEKAYEEYDRREFDGQPMHLTLSHMTTTIDMDLVKKVLFGSRD